MSTAPRTRADAVRNSERVLAAATELLAEKGAEAGVPEIAARAGVGKGTVYRCFPTKEHLISAVISERVRSFATAAEAAAERPDAWQAFVDLLTGSAEQMAGDCTFSAGLSHESTLPEVAAAKQEMFAALDALMARAQAQGAMRAGVDSRDVRVLFAGVSQMLRAAGDRDPATWRRYAGLVADAMRA
jgi:AcrR family transcriptional regulator